ncbi:hypothetical protein AAFF_G00019110 [Aldrovandia affinis]|uniref:Uncharacterized protein n=1 Tax=Aldrovandia affinis TaxID=143900 RepID=A0AAD7S5D7_9TELE|nr:hypothetical protein AAFF_G00019110 [Aldrovandia affinis]
MGRVRRWADQTSVGRGKQLHRQLATGLGCELACLRSRTYVSMQAKCVQPRPANPRGSCPVPHCSVSAALAGPSPCLLLARDRGDRWARSAASLTSRGHASDRQTPAPAPPGHPDGGAAVLEMQYHRGRSDGPEKCARSLLAVSFSHGSYQNSPAAVLTPESSD